MSDSLEKFIDFIYPYYNEELGKLKDIMAGIVLLAVISSGG